MTGPKVAIVHDWLVDTAGASREILEVCKAFPGAPLYTSVYFPEQASPEFKDVDVRTSFIQKMPFFKNRHQLAFWLRMIHWARLNLNEYDIIISSSGSEAKGINTSRDQLHVNVCYTPTHYYWSHFEEYLKTPGLGWLDPLARVGLKALVVPLRWLDKQAAQKPDKIVAISSAVQKRIKKYYGRNSTVIFPPVDTKKYANDASAERSGYIVVGRQVPYKRIDLPVRACSALGKKLVVVGTGPDHQKLKDLAGPSIEFLGHASEANKTAALKAANCFIFPNEDDFGIVPVEAMSAGAAVIAFKAGGALDTVIDQKTGIFFEDQTSHGLQQAIKLFEKQNFDNDAIAKHAKQFDNLVFRKNVKQFVDQSWSQHSPKQSGDV